MVLGISAGKQTKAQQGSAAEASSMQEELDLEARSRKLQSESLSASQVAMSAASVSSVTQIQGEVVNQKALSIVKRVKDKLTGGLPLLEDLYSRAH